MKCWLKFIVYLSHFKTLINDTADILAKYCHSLNMFPSYFYELGESVSVTNEEFWIEYLRNMEMVFWKVKYAGTLDEGQFKEKLLEALKI